MNARQWFYGTSFHGNVDRSTHASYEQISTKQACPLCHCEVKMGLETWAKLDGKIAHDYCIRTKLGK